MTTSDEERSRNDAFVWPPRRANESRHIDAAVAPALLNPLHAERATAPETRPIGSLSGVWSSIETEWLGRTHAPWVARAAAAGWAPDPAGAYCPRCGDSVGPGELVASEPSDGYACAGCRDRRLRWTRFIRLGRYDGVLREAITEVKFQQWRRLGTTLGELLGESIARELHAACVPAERIALVPMGVSFRRRVSRGIDHSLVLSRGVRKRTGGQIVRALRRRHGPSQIEVAPSRRASNVSSIFWVRRASRLAGRHVIVIDDVRTTGATMSAACRAIQAATSQGPPTAIRAAVLAVTPSANEGHRDGASGKAAGLVSAEG